MLDNVREIDVDFRVRWYQRKFHEALVGDDCTRLIEIAHRRWGKDEIAMNGFRDLSQKRPGTYWHCFPEYSQARKAIWNGINGHTGVRRIDEIYPPEVRKRINDTDMFIETVWGSTWQLLGSDRYDATVGAGPVGIAYSEWALCNPSAWAYHKPMIEETGGKAAFITTPRGNNHARSMFEFAQGSDKWFAELSTIEDTGVFDAEKLAEIKAEYIALYGHDFGTSQYEQEYLCSFDSAVLGAYYSHEMAKALKDERITKVPHTKGKPVHSMWDLGRTDRTVLWLFQEMGQAWHIIGCIYNAGVDLDWFMKQLEDDKYGDYVWGTDYIPHDGSHERLGMLKSIDRQLRDFGRKTVKVVKSPPGSVQIGINEVRKVIGKSWFDKEACAQGIEALRMYRKEWDDDKKIFKDKPRHDWCSDFADAFRTGAMGHVIQGKAAPLEYNNTGIV